MAELFTIGHSNHRPEHFLRLLNQHAVEVVADVRSSPRSRHAEWADRGNLSQLLEGDAKRYLFLGHELGGRPKGSHFYDTEGHVAYGRVAESVGFQKGIGRLRRGIAKFRVAIMCAEEDPTHCHRRLLVARVLGRGAVSIQHIRGDGTLQSESELAVGPQPEELFPREDAWRSTRSVLRRQPRVTSSVD